VFLAAVQILARTEGEGAKLRYRDGDTSLHRHSIRVAVIKSPNPNAAVYRWKEPVKDGGREDGKGNAVGEKKS